MKMTTFKAALMLCGLTQDDFCEMFGNPLPTVKAWASGKNAPPAGVFEQLSGYYHSRIEPTADYAAGMIEPEMMDRKVMNNIQADDGNDPLPGYGADVAGAMALFLAIQDSAK